MFRTTGNLLLTLIMLALATPAIACEYCVREVGFVPIYNDPYRVVIAVGDDTPQDQRDDLLAKARAGVGPSNVVVTLGSPSEGEVFADAATLSGDELPAAVLYAPDGRAARLASPEDLQSAAWANNIAGVTHSPAREGLGQALVDTYGVVVLVEGTDAEANAVARELAENAIARIDDAKASFDRPIELGPTLRSITAEDRAAERWLLFGLDISVTPSELPEVAILFGQGKRLGSVLQGASLTSASLFTNLAHIGRDCECSLDRHWLYGSKIPMVWDDGLRRRAYDTLGFDPESAATRAEVGRILDRGQDLGGSSGGGIAGNDPYASQDLGGFGLTIYDLGDTSSNVAQAPDPASDTDTPGPASNTSQAPPTTPATATPAKDANPAAIMVNRGLQMIAGAVMIVIAGAVVLIFRARRSH